MNTKNFDSNHYKTGQSQQWDSVANGWEKWWETFERTTQNVSQSLIRLADIKPSHNVLDIATGIGEPAASIAQKVGQEGHVVAIDQSSEMLTIAKKRANKLKLINISFEKIDAEKLSFPEAHFDAITCRWGFMFLPNIKMVLSSINRVLKSDGKLAVAIWDVPENIPFFSTAMTRMKKMFEVPPPAQGAPTLSGLSGGVIENLMRQAGFTNIKTVPITVNFEFPSAKDYAQFMKDIAAPIQSFLQKKSKIEQNNYWQSLELDAKKYSIANGSVCLPSISPCIVGQK